jgi:hypothetical protein
MMRHPVPSCLVPAEHVQLIGMQGSFSSEQGEVAIASALKAGAVDRIKLCMLSLLEVKGLENCRDERSNIRKHKLSIL